MPRSILVLSLNKHRKVIYVGEDSPADLAGIEVGDRLLRLNGQDLVAKGLFNRLQSELRWGDRATVEVGRGADTLSLEVLFRRSGEEQDESVATDRAPRENEVVVLGMIHGGHRTSDLYSTDILRETLRRIDPDYVLTEIPPDRFDAASAQFEQDGSIEESRVSRFPEYVDVLFPLTEEIQLTIVPTAGWTREMADDRRAKLEEWATSREPQSAEVDAAQQAAEQQIAEQGGEDNPLFIHSDPYDAIVKKGMEPYDRLFNDDLGAGGWTNINKAHYRHIEEALDAHSGEGVRIVITYGAWHKYWFLEQLRLRDDIVLLDAGTFFNP